MALFRRKRSSDAPESMQALADKLGLAYADEVDDDYLATMGPLPDLPLLREGNDDSMTKVLYGTIDDVEIRMFEFESASHADVGGIGRSCILLTFNDTVLPEVFIAPKARLPRLGEKLREGGIPIGSTELMQKYAVQAHNRESATDMISPDIEQWLIACPIENLRIEMRGGAILGHVPEVGEPEEFVRLLDFMRGFHERIPERVWQNYRKLQ